VFLQAAQMTDCSKLPRLHLPRLIRPLVVSHLAVSLRFTTSTFPFQADPPDYSIDAIAASSRSRNASKVPSAHLPRGIRARRERNA
jgi:hypothetical protein